MKNLIKFNEYLITKLFESMDLKIAKLELILSPRLIKILKEIDHKISHDLLKLNRNSDTEFTKTFIDLGTKSDEITFIQSNKIADLVEPDISHGKYQREFDKEKKYTGGSYGIVPIKKNPWISDLGHLPDLRSEEFTNKEHPVWTKNRVPINVGTFISRTFPNKYPANHKREDLAKMTTPDDIGSFVNMFKATVELHGKILKLVSGEDIKYWYSEERQFKSSGTLGGSCMRSANKSKFFDIYCQNLDKVQMLILYPDDVRDKIMGRAIVWKLDEPDSRYYMDRIYTNNDSDQYIFIEYAKQNGWLYKSSQVFNWNLPIVDPKKSETKWIPMSLTVKSGEYKYYPYLDTLQFYNPETGLLTSDGDISDIRDFHKLTNADGRYNGN